MTEASKTEAITQEGRGNRFALWSDNDLAAQAKMQARDNLDPEYSKFMEAMADRLMTKRCCYGHTEHYAGCEDCPYVHGAYSETKFEADRVEVTIADRNLVRDLATLRKEDGREAAIRLVARHRLAAEARNPANHPDQATSEELARVKQRVDEAIEEGGSWRACSGCQEGEDGYVSARDYPYSALYRCQPGGGCTECGGIGVLWEAPGYWDGLWADPEAAQPTITEPVESEQ